MSNERPLEAEDEYTKYLGFGLSNWHRGYTEGRYDCRRELRAWFISMFAVYLVGAGIIGACCYQIGAN